MWASHYNSTKNTYPSQLQHNRSSDFNYLLQDVLESCILCVQEKECGDLINPWEIVIQSSDLYRKPWESKKGKALFSQKLRISFQSGSPVQYHVLKDKKSYKWVKIIYHLINKVKIFFIWKTKSSTLRLTVNHSIKCEV